MRGLTIAIGIAGLLAVPALAQPASPDGPPPGPMTRADTLAAVRAQFARMDTNGDGVIDRAEFDAARAAMLAERGPPPADGTPPPPRGGMGMGPMGGMGGRWFERVDTDQDGKVTPAEAERATMAVFDLVDTNHDGTISSEERHTAMEMMRAMHPGRGE